MRTVLDPSLWTLASWRSRVARSHADWLLGGSSWAVQAPLTLRTCLRLECFTEGPLDIPNHIPVPEIRRGEAAIHHLFTVAAGLDSIIPGESAIQGQIRALLESRDGEIGFRGSMAHRVLMAMVRCGKVVRAQTPLGEVAESWGGMVLGRLANWCAKNAPVSSDGPILVLGSGRFAREVSSLLKQNQYPVILCGRHGERVAETARLVNAPFIPLENLSEMIPRAAAVVSCASPLTPWWGREKDLAHQEIFGLPTQPRLFLDLASPRSFDPDLKTLPAVTLEDLGDFPTKAADEAVLAQARGLIAQQVQDFFADNHRRRLWVMAGQRAGSAAQIGPL